MNGLPLQASQLTSLFLGACAVANEVRMASTLAAATAVPVSFVRIIMRFFSACWLCFAVLSFRQKTEFINLVREHLEHLLDYDTEYRLPSDKLIVACLEVSERE